MVAPYSALPHRGRPAGGNPIKRYGYIGDGRRAMQTLKEKVLDKVLLRRTKAERAADVTQPGGSGSHPP